MRSPQNCARASWEVSSRLGLISRTAEGSQQSRPTRQKTPGFQSSGSCRLARKDHLRAITCFVDRDGHYLMEFVGTDFCAIKGFQCVDLRWCWWLPLSISSKAKHCISIKGEWNLSLLEDLTFESRQNKRCGWIHRGCALKQRWMNTAELQLKWNLALIPLNFTCHQEVLITGKETFNCGLWQSDPIWRQSQSAQLRGCQSTVLLFIRTIQQLS